MTIGITINGTRHELDAPAEMPLLWALREVAGLTGTKYGCGIGVCGACTVHVDGMAERACLLQLGDVGERPVTTIEGLAGAPDGEHLHPVQEAWIAANIPQCGYCQPGFIMQVSDLLANAPQISDEDLASTIINVCRCGTYARMKPAIAAARKALQENDAGQARLASGTGENA